MSNVLITGANSGFGLLTARKFAESGHTVHAGFRSKERAGDLDALAREFPNVHPVQLDVTNQALIDAAVSTARKAGPIDVLVNNAGYELTCPVDSLSDEAMTSIFDTNVYGVVRMIRAVSPEMRDRKQGAIVNLSSIVGWLTPPYTGAYAATKHAVESLSEALWYELAPFGIRVAVIEPGVFLTSFRGNIVTSPEYAEGSPHWKYGERYRDAVRPGIEGNKSDPQEVADLVFEAVTSATPKFRYLAGDDARSAVPIYKKMEFEQFREALLVHSGLADWTTQG